MHQWRHQRAYVHHLNLDVHRWLLLPSGVDLGTGGSQRRHVQRWVLLPRWLCVRQWRLQRGYVHHHNLDLLRWIFLPSGVDDGTGGSQRRTLHCGILLPRGRHYDHGRRDRRNVRRGNLLSRRCGIYCGQWRMRRGIILSSGRDDGRWWWDGRRMRSWVLLPRELRLLQRSH